MVKQQKPLSARNQFLFRFMRDKYLHLLVLPAMLYFIIFCYVPMYGLIVAFKDFSFTKGILDSPWVGMKHFEAFFDSIFFFRLIKNTIILSVMTLIFSFPIPIIFALLLNEVKFKKFRNTIQTISYFPHFVSIVIVVGMMHILLSPETGLINAILSVFNIEPIAFMQSSGWFRPLYVLSNIWQSFGWSSIIYLAALSGVQLELYEAAQIDGAGRFKQVLHVSIPAILPIVIILFILQIGGLMEVGYEKILLMYNPGIYEVSDVISTYVYRKSILGGEYSFGTAIGFFNNVINFILIVVVNSISKKVSSVSLW